MKLYHPAFLLQRSLLILFVTLLTLTTANAQVGITCPDDISQNNDPGVCGALVNFLEPIGSGSGTGITTTRIAGFPPGSIFDVGTTQVTYQVTNNEGDTAECSFFITINDIEPPVFSCPADFSVTAIEGECSAIVTFPTPTATDNCAVFDTYQFAGLTSGSEFTVGIHNLDFTSFDSDGNQAFCRVILTVLDAEDPVLNCPNDTLVSVNNNCEAVVNYTAPVGVDACLPANTVQTEGLGSGASFPIGTTIETYTTTDTDGNTATCSFNITVVDDTPPIIDCPSDVTVNIDSGDCNTIINFSLPTVTDNCPGVTIEQTNGLTSGDSFPTGDNTVVFTATDSSGNTTTCSYTYFVYEPIPPTIDCSAPITVNNDPGLCGATVNYIPPLGFDNCINAITQITGGLGSGSFFPVGTTEEIYVVTDPSGNTATCSIQITVLDVENPVFNCSNIFASADAGECETVVNFPTPSATDNCAVLSVVQTAGSSPGTTFPVGSSQVEFTATDNSGNTTICTFNVVVEDNEPPEIICPADFNYTIPADSCTAALIYPDPVFSDNCSGSIFSVVSGPASGDVVSAGIYTILLQATDIAGNTTDCSLTATIAETTLPVIICPGDSIYPPDVAGGCEATITFDNPIATDDCSAVTVSQTGGLTSGSVFPAGINPIEFTATDAFGNTATCAYNIIVQENDLPEITCPDSIIATTEPGVCEATVVYNSPTTNDNCGITTVTMTSGLASGSVFPEGETMITYEITDLNGNSASCSFTVTVVDEENPVISCPADISINIPDGDCNAIVNYALPTATDNCGVADILLTDGLASGDIFPSGTNLVNYIATDISGNISSCSFNVIVLEGVPPTISCSAAIEADNDIGECAAIVNYDAPIGTDNCGNAVTELSGGLGSGESFPVGVSTETYTVTDASGNQTSCSFTITILDTEAPVFTCSNDIIANSADTICGIIYNFVVPEASDNCTDVLDIVQMDGPVSGSILPLGQTNFVFTTTDDAGNTATCEYFVTVIDFTPPSLNDCPVDTTFYVSNVGCTAMIDFDMPVATDNCNVSIAQTLGPESGDELSTGSYPIEFTATDNAGNESICSFTIFVLDTIAPVIDCPEGFETCSSTPEFDEPQASDNCSLSNISQISGLISGSQFPVGETTLTYVATDGSGNTDTCSFSIIVLDSAPEPQAGLDITICDGVNSTLIGSDPMGYTSNWTLLEGEGTIADSTAVQTEVSELSAGTNVFVYSLNPENGCSVRTDILNVFVETEISVNAGEDEIISSGNSISLSATASPEGGTFTWLPPTDLTCTECQNTIASPNKTTLYAVTYTTALGCERTDSVMVNVYEELPNTITPDGDAVNDVWNIPSIENYPQVLVVIYNRWGNTVYESTGYDEPWDGTHKGKDLPTGSYYYIIDYKVPSVENLSGTVNIIR